MLRTTLGMLQGLWVSTLTGSISRLSALKSKRDDISIYTKFLGADAVPLPCLSGSAIYMHAFSLPSMWFRATWIRQGTIKCVPDRDPEPALSTRSCIPRKGKRCPRDRERRGPCSAQCDLW